MSFGFMLKEQKTALYSTMNVVAAESGRIWILPPIPGEGWRLRIWGPLQAAGMAQFRPSIDGNLGAWLSQSSYASNTAQTNARLTSRPNLSSGGDMAAILVQMEFLPVTGLAGGDDCLFRLESTGQDGTYTRLQQIIGCYTGLDEPGVLSSVGFDMPLGQVAFGTRYTLERLGLVYE